MLRKYHQSQINFSFLSLLKNCSLPTVRRRHLSGRHPPSVQKVSQIEKTEMADALFDLINSLRMPPTQISQPKETDAQATPGKRVVQKRPRKHSSYSEFQGLDWVELLQRYC